MEELKKLGFRLVLCSNLAMPYEKVVSSLLPNIDAYAWSYEVSAIKPESQIYQYLIDQLGRVINYLEENHLVPIILL